MKVNSIADYSIGGHHVAATARMSAEKANASAEEEEDPCAYEFGEDAVFRFILIVSTMGAAYVVGFLGNSVSIYVYTRKTMLKPNNLFLILLSAFNLGFLVTSLLVCVLEVAYDFHQSFDLYVIYINCLKEAFFVNLVCQTGAVYATVGATLERWIFLGHSGIVSPTFCSKPSRVIISTASIVAFVLTTQLPIYFEIEIVEVENCTGFGHYAMAPSELRRNEMYALIYKTILWNIFFIFLPFALVFMLNGAILYRIWRHQAEDAQTTPMYLRAWVQRIQERIEKRRIVHATIVMMIIGITFLICNLPNVVLTITERAAPEFLGDHPKLYAFARDLNNILQVVNASVNVIIYITFGKDFRQEIYLLFNRVMLVIGLRKPPATTEGFPEAKDYSHLLRHMKQPDFTMTERTRLLSSGTEPEGGLKEPAVMNGSQPETPVYQSVVNNENYLKGIPSID